MRIALIKNAIVENIIEATPEFAASLDYDQVIDVDNLQSGIGWSFDGAKFINPQAVAQPQPPKPLTKFQFISLLTVEERICVYEAETKYPFVRMWLETFRICQEIDLTNPDTIAGVQMLEANGLIAPGRATEILQNRIL